MADEIKKVTLQDILNQRETRVLQQTQLIKTFDLPVICLTLNIPGSVKRTELTYAAFQSGNLAIENALNQNNIQICHTIFTDDFTGTEKFWSVSCNPELIKRILVELEEAHPLGRIFDIDVIAVSGKKISRADISFSERSCILCGKPGPFCARNRTHSVLALTEFINNLIKTHI